MLRSVEVKRREIIEEKESKALKEEEAMKEFFDWVDEIHEYNRDVDPEVIEREVEEAVKAVRKQKKEEMASKA